MLLRFFPIHIRVQFCSVVLGYRYLKLLDRVISGARILTGVWLNVKLILNCQFVAVLCMLCKIKCNPMHRLYGALPDRMCKCGLHAVL